MAPANPPAVRVRARVLAALLVITLSCPAALPASPSGPAPAFSAVVADDVAADATSSNNQVKLVRDPSGTLLVALVVNVDGVPQVVLARSRDGGRRWAPFAQASTGPIASRLPALGLDPPDGLHVVWTRYDDGVGKVYYRRWRGGGWTAPQARISPLRRYAGFPSLAVDPAGQPQVAWYGIREGAVESSSRHGSIYEIFYTGFDGREWSAPQLISTGVPDAVNPALAADRSGRLHAAWFQSDGRVYQIRYAVRGASWTEPATVLATAGADAFNPDLAVGPRGPVVLAWEHHAGAASVIRATRRVANQWEEPADLSDSAAPALHPSVAVGAGGEAYVAWETDGGQIVVRRFARLWEPAIRLTDDGGNTFPSVAASGAGADLVWTHAVGGRAAVRYLRLGPAPARGSGAAAGREWLGGAAALALAILILAWRRRPRPGPGPA